MASRFQVCALALAFGFAGTARAELPVDAPSSTVGALEAAQTDVATARARSLAGRIDARREARADGGVDWGLAEGVVDATPVRVMTVLHDYAHYAHLFPHFEKSRVLAQRGKKAIVYLEAKILHGAVSLWSQVKIRQLANVGPSQVLEVEMMRGKGNMDAFVARWTVTPVEGGARSLVRFELLVDPGLPAVPDVLVSDQLRRAARTAIKSLRKRSHG